MGLEPIPSASQADALPVELQTPKTAALELNQRNVALQATALATRPAADSRDCWNRTSLMPAFRKQ